MAVHTTNEYKEQVKSYSIVYIECHLFFTLASWYVPRYSQGDSRVNLLFGTGGELQDNNKD